MCTPSLGLPKGGRNTDGTTKSTAQQTIERRQEDIQKQNLNLNDAYGPKNELIPQIPNSFGTTPKPTTSITVGELSGRQRLPIPEPQLPKQPEPVPPAQTPTPDPTPPPPQTYPDVIVPSPNPLPQTQLMIKQPEGSSKRKKTAAKTSAPPRPAAIGVNKGPTNNNIGLNIPT